MDIVDNKMLAEMDKIDETTAFFEIIKIILKLEKARAYPNKMNNMTEPQFIDDVCNLTIKLAEKSTNAIVREDLSVLIANNRILKDAVTTLCILERGVSEARLKLCKIDNYHRYNTSFWSR